MSGSKQNPLVTWCREAFLDSIVKDKPSHISLTEMLDSVLGVAERTIVYAQAKESFRVPGFYLGDGPHKQLPLELDYRLVKNKEVLTIRKDVREDWFDLEREGYGVFRLNQLDWNTLYGKLKFLEKPSDEMIQPPKVTLGQRRKLW